MATPEALAQVLRIAAQGYFEALVSFNPLGGLNRLTAILSHATAELANLANFEVVEN